MTAPTLLVDDGDADVGSGSDDTWRGRGPAATTPPRRRVPSALPLVVAVAVPLVLFTIGALHTPLNFDGGMNLQVAKRLAEGEGYTRFYDELRVFPHEVQTNGPFMYVAAAAIWVFGAGQFAYQFANLVFVAAFAAVVFLLLREHPVLRVAGPLVVLLTAPQVAVYGLGGLGEVPMSAFVFATLLALAEAVRSPARAPWWVAAAALAFGAAVATKTFAVGSLGAVALGGACVLVAAPTWRVRLESVAAGAAVVVLPAIRELHRLVATGGVSEYRAWWSSEQGSISKQAGLEEDRSVDLVERFRGHMHILSGHLDAPGELLLVVILVPLVWVAAVLLWRCRAQGLRRTLTDAPSVLLLMVGVVAASYIAWWLLFVPETKTWIRRIYPGMLALQVLYLFMVAWLVQVGRSAFSPPRRWWPAVGVVAVAVVVATTALPYTVGKVEGNGRSLLEGENAWLDANQDAVDYIHAHPDQRFYGDEWWSAPVVSLMADQDFANLGDTHFCSLDPGRDRLVWDFYAYDRHSHEPWTRGGALTYKKVAAFGNYVTIYAVGPGPKSLCR